MAKSKSGGSRSYLRGRLGSDVYSIGRTAKGKRQQVVRSLAEEVKNPQTAAQMKGRAIMSTVMQAVSAMSPIINHSFDGFAAGQPSISEFIAQNYALIKNDVAANSASQNNFGIVKYGEKGAKMGAYLISNGKAISIQNATMDYSAKTVTIAVGAELTPANLRAALGIGVNDYFTVCSILANGTFAYQRARVFADMDADAAITAENIGDVFVQEGNNAFVATIDGTNIVLTYTNMSSCFGVIVSRQTESGYIHSRCVLTVQPGTNWPFDVAIATYPEGERRFLNGGSDELVSAADQSSSSAAAYTGQLTALTYNAVNVLSDAASTTAVAEAAIAGSVSEVPETGELALYIGSTKIGVISSANFNLTAAVGNTGAITLKYNNVTKQTCGTINEGADVPPEGGGGFGG